MAICTRTELMVFWLCLSVLKWSPIVNAHQVTSKKHAVVYEERSDNGTSDIFLRQIELEYKTNITFNGRVQLENGTELFNVSLETIITSPDSLDFTILKVLGKSIVYEQKQNLSEPSWLSERGIYKNKHHSSVTTTMREELEELEKDLNITKMVDKATFINMGFDIPLEIEKHFSPLLWIIALPVILVIGLSIVICIIKRSTLIDYLKTGLRISTTKNNVDLEHGARILPNNREY